MREKRGRGRRMRWVIGLAAALVLGGAAGGALAWWLGGPGPFFSAPAPAPGVGAGASAPQGAGSAEAPPPAPEAQWPDVSALTPRAYKALPLPEEMRAMWLSFLEWKETDFSTEESARAALAVMLDNCAALGLNTVMVATRPFGDAIYPSEEFPWSHVLNGAQGQNPGYDPLALMVEEAHARGLRVEAWINPYRVQDTVNGPKALSPDNPASLYPQLVRSVGGNLWYDPGLPEVKSLVVRGVLEIVLNYDVDGIHFDDYFYPEFSAQQVEDGEDLALDAGAFEKYNPDGLDLAAWRRENVNSLVWHVYEAVKAANPTASFGISPQGNNENNYQSQYSDVRHWMASPGYVDYVMPQLYWGFGYRTQSGRDSFAFENITAEWAFYPRIDGVRLFAGLGAYRIGAGDGGSADTGEWETGRNLADQVQHLRAAEGFSGFALFRYEFLYQNKDYPELGLAEAAALAELLSGEQGGAQSMPAA